MAPAKPAAIITFPDATIAVEEGAPAPETILAGKPVNRTWNHYESADGKFFSGIWEADIGSWIINYVEDEYCVIL